MPSGLLVDAEPAGASSGDAAEEDVGLDGETEEGPGGQVVEEDGRGVGRAAQLVLDATHQGAAERYARREPTDGGLDIGREEGEAFGHQACVLGLPFVAMGCGGAVFEVRLEVGRFVEEDPQEEEGRQIAVDRHFMKSVSGLRPSVVAVLGAASAGDVEVDAVTVEVGIGPVDSVGRQVVGQDGAVSFLGGQNVGQSQLLRRCLYMCSPELQAEQTREARSTARTSLTIGFRFMQDITQCAGENCGAELKIEN